MNGDIRVLHIEDEPDFADLTKVFVERENEQISIEIESNATAALDRLEAGDFDCIVSDYDMPEMNGIEVLEVVRREHPEIPFILFTGKGSEEVAGEAISSGVSDYLQKKGGTSQYALLANRIENVVAQHRSTHALERTERRYHRLIEEANDVITILDGNGQFEYITPGSRRILGYDPDDLIGENGFDYIHPDDVEHAMELFFEMVEEPELRPTTEFRFERPDGSWMWVEVTGRNLMDDPVIDGIVVYARNVTERKESQRKFEQYRTLVENVGDPMYILDADGVIQLVNAAFEDALGYSAEEAIGRPVGDFMPEEDVLRGNELIKGFLEDDERDAASFEMVAITKSGEEQLHETKLAVLTENAEFVGSVGVFREITQRKASERALQRERDRLESLFDNLPTPVIRIDMAHGESIIKQVNPEFESTFGYTKEEVVGKSLDDVTVPENRQDEAAAIYEKLLAEGRFQVEVTRETADGLREFGLNGVLRNPDSDMPEGYIIYTDITNSNRQARDHPRSNGVRP